MGTESEDLIINLLFDRIPMLWNKNGVLFINFNYFPTVNHGPQTAGAYLPGG